MGWIITVVILFALTICPLGASVLYNQDGLLAYLILGPFYLKVFPMKKKDKKGKKAKAKPQKKEVTHSGSKKKTKENKSGGSITDFLPLVQIALDFLGDLRRKLRVNKLEMKMTLAGGDPCDLAVNYGRAWAALGNLLPLLEQVLVIKKRDLEVACDFTADKTLIYAHADLTITLGRILSLGVLYGIRVLREFIKIMNKRKGGAKT